MKIPVFQSMRSALSSAQHIPPQGAQETSPLLLETLSGGSWWNVKGWWLCWALDFNSDCVYFIRTRLKLSGLRLSCLPGRRARFPWVLFRIQVKYLKVTAHRKQQWQHFLICWPSATLISRSKFSRKSVQLWVQRRMYWKACCLVADQGNKRGRSRVNLYRITVYDFGGFLRQVALCALWSAPHIVHVL